MSDSFYSTTELKNIGFKNIGSDVLISKKASIYSPEKIELGNHVRIDDFCILSGNICIGDYVHISAYVALYGGGGIKIGSYCGISPKCIIFSVSDDFSGENMISPLVPYELTKVTKSTVTMENFSQLGASTVVMPGVVVREGAVTGVMAYVKNSLEPWTINVGVPARFLKKRSMNVKTLSSLIK